MYSWRKAFGLSLALAFCGTMAAPCALAERKIPARQNTVRIDRSDMFDKPLAEVVVQAEPPKYNPWNHAYLACFFYPDFVVKELDLGEKGAEKLSIAPTRSSQSTPPCSTQTLPGEKIVKNELGGNWSGYFKGVKGHFALVEWSDSMNGGLGFGVLNTRTGATIFTDSASVVDGFFKVEIVGATLTLEYRRSLSPGCSLMTDRGLCWRKIAGATGLADDRRPDCAFEYARFYPAAGEPNGTGSSSKQVQALDKIPSVVAYNARALVGEKLERLEPRPGSASCAVSE